MLIVLGSTLLRRKFAKYHAAMVQLICVLLVKSAILTSGCTAACKVGISQQGDKDFFPFTNDIDKRQTSPLPSLLAVVWAKILKKGDYASQMQGDCTTVA